MCEMRKLMVVAGGYCCCPGKLFCGHRGWTKSEFIAGAEYKLARTRACSGCYSFNNLLYKEWLTNDDKDCSIIPIKLRRYRKKLSYRNEYYFVIIVNIICCFKNKEDYFIIINFHVHLQAACVLDQKSFRALDLFFPLVTFLRLTFSVGPTST